jgi:hypothetical protein
MTLLLPVIVLIHLAFWGLSRKPAAKAGVPILKRELGVSLLVYPIWFALVAIASQIHPKTLSNVVELFVILALCSLAFLTRGFVAKSTSLQAATLRALFMGWCLVCPIIVWGVMPVLPE